MNYPDARQFKVLVMGASEKEDRYSNRAVKLLTHYQFDVVAIGNREGKIGDVIIRKGFIPFEKVHTVTLYLNAMNQKQYYDYIIALRPKRIIFNPGAENAELAELALKNNIATEEACTLVLLNTGGFLNHR